MEINVLENGSNLTVEISGKIDTITSPELEKCLIDAMTGKSETILDFDKVNYISSAGLRVVLFAKKVMDKENGKFAIINVDEDVFEVFEMTGFSDALEIKKKPL